MDNHSSRPGDCRRYLANCGDGGLELQSSMYELGIFAILSIGFVFFWLLWVRFCLQQWMYDWADRNSMRLIACKLRLIRRGPYNLTIPFYPVFRVTTKNNNGELLNGWVRLGLFGFSAAWDYDSTETRVR